MAKPKRSETKSDEMPRNGANAVPTGKQKATAPVSKPSALVDTRVIYCGDNLEQLRKLPVARGDCAEAGMTD